jgi:spermidine/putrescine-binding protein
MPSLVFAKEKLRVFTWDGYITKDDINNINKQFTANKINYEVDIVSPFAEGSDQMFNIIRSGKCDISFLTLFFIKMKQEKITNLLQPINTKSKYLTNYGQIIPELTRLSMGVKNKKPLYIPYGGGVYGFWANMNKVKESELPKSIADLWDRRWKNKISLNRTQIWYNIGITMMALGKEPFHINNLVLKNQRNKAVSFLEDQQEVQQKLIDLYNQAGNFWNSGTEFHPNLEIVSSWGPEMERRNAQTKENWKLIKFKEGNIVWLDTINFVKGVKGNKLAAAEIFANYFIDKKSQTRVVQDLSMISVSNSVSRNPYVDQDPTIFNSKMFVPPYSRLANNIMQILSNNAFKAIKKD